MSTTSPLSPPFASVRFADNPEPRAPCVLVVDSAMAPAQLRHAERLIATLVQQWTADPEPARSVELAVVTAGPPTVASPFAMVESFVAPTLHPGNGEAIAPAVDLAIDLVTQRKSAIRAEGLQLYQPSILLLTTGDPAGPWDATADRIRAGANDRDFHTFAIAIDDADVGRLHGLTGALAVPASKLNLRDLLPWVG